MELFKEGQHSKADRVYTYVKDLKDRDCGIDGVGF